MGLVVLLVVGVFFIQLPCHLAFDALVKEQHRSHLGDWKQDGRPQGFYWSAEGGILSRMTIGHRERCFVVWLFKTPHWVMRSETAKNNIRRFRRFAVLGIIFGAVCLWLIT